MLEESLLQQLRSCFMVRIDDFVLFLDYWGQKVNSLCCEIKINLS